MSMYHCSRCDRLCDSDWELPEEDPEQLGLICELCQERLFDENGNLQDWLDTTKRSSLNTYIEDVK